MRQYGSDSKAPVILLLVVGKHFQGRTKMIEDGIMDTMQGAFQRNETKVAEVAFTNQIQYPGIFTARRGTRLTGKLFNLPVVNSRQSVI